MKIINFRGFVWRWSTLTYCHVRTDWTRMLRLVLNQSFFDNVLLTNRIKLLRMDFNMILRCFMPQFLCREVILPQKHVRTRFKKILRQIWCKFQRLQQKSFSFGQSHCFSSIHLKVTWVWSGTIRNTSIKKGTISQFSFEGK